MNRRIDQNQNVTGLISVVIIIVLLFQGIISLALPPLNPRKVTHSWPFINYPMYRNIHREGETIPERTIIAVDKHGRAFVAKRRDLWFYDIFASAIINGERNTVKDFIQGDANLRERNWKMIRVVEGGSIFTLKGQSPAPETELGSMFLNANEGESQ